MKLNEGALLRRGYERERRNAADNHRRAVGNARDILADVQVRLDASEPPLLADLRRLVVEATEAYQRAASLQALDQVAFLLPDNDETKD